MFAIDIQDKLSGLKSVLSIYRANKLNTALAEMIAIYTWSFCDWIDREYKETHGFETLGKLQQYLRAECTELKYLQDVANCSKHVETDYTRTATNANEHKGAFSQGFSSAFDISYLYITTNSGEKIRFDDAVNVSIEFIETYISNLEEKSL